MKNAFKISVIVPVYNAEKFLRRAMDSLIKQTIFEDMEIIAVDDGSTDQSGAVLDGYSSQYPNISAYHIANGGVSNARNFGMEQVHAEYLGFLDADDWVDPDYFEKMLGAIKDGGADMAVCGFSVETDAGLLVTNPVPAAVNSFSGNESVKALFGGQIDVHVFTKLYRTEFIRNTRFDTELHYGEDRLFVLSALTQAESVVLVKGCVYHYYQNSQSAMHQALSDRSFETLTVGKKIIARITATYPELIPYAECDEINIKCRLLGEIAHQDKIEQYHDRYIQLCRDVREFDLAKAYRYSSRKHFLALLLVRISPRLYGQLRSIPALRFKK